LWEKEEIGFKGERKAHGGSWWLIGGYVGFMWWSWWWLWLVARTAKRERERKKLQKRGREAGFLPTLDPIFSSLKP
jgi:type VI protein secretion system component VasK